MAIADGAVQIRSRSTLSRGGLRLYVWAVGALVAIGVAGGCVSSQRGRPMPQADVRIVDPPQQAGRELVLVLMPFGRQTQTMWATFVAEVGTELNVVTVDSTNLSVEGLGAALTHHAPKLLVLVDNRNVELYRKYQQSRPTQTAFPPALVLMSSFAAEFIQGIKHVVAIGHEPPALTAMVAMRRILDRPLATMGVVYRRPLASFVERQALLAEIERIHFKTVELGPRPTRNELEWALDRLVDDQAIDVLWVLNDNVLLSPEYLREVWLPTLHRNHLPVVVGVESLVNPELDFGSLAVTPDLELLGVQAANLVLDMRDDDWKLESGVQQPLSVKTLLNAPQARKHLGLTDAGILKADEAIE